MRYKTPEQIISDFLQKGEKLDPIARGEIFWELNEKFDWPWSKIAREIKKSPAYVINTIRLLKLPEAIKDGLISGLISEGHARALLGIGDIRTSIEAYKNILRNRFSVREAETIVRRLKKELEAEKEEKLEFSEIDEKEKENQEKINHLLEEVKTLLRKKGRAVASFSLGGARIEMVIDARKTEVLELLEKILQGLKS